MRKKISLITLALSMLMTIQVSAQKIRVYAQPSDAEIYLNAIDVNNPQKVNLNDPNIGLVAVKKGYATAALKPFDLRDEDVGDSYTITLEELYKLPEDYKSQKIEFTVIEDRTGKIDKPASYGFYGVMTRGTSLEDEKYTTAINDLTKKWGYNVIGTNTLFKNEKEVPDFGLGGEITYFAKDTRGSGFQIMLFIKWSLYSVDKEKVVYEKEVGAYSDSRSTTDFNTELIFTLEDALKAVLGDPEFAKIVSSEAKDESDAEEFEPIEIENAEYERPSDYSDFVQDMMNSVVTVKTDFGQGSGFIISESGYIITNDHVVKNADEIEVVFNNGFSFKAEPVRSSSKRDIALIKVQGSGFTPIQLSEVEKSSAIGQDVIVIGSPQGLDQTVTKGIISGHRKGGDDDLPYLQTDVAINKGNSGGPLINSKNGEVVGIVVAKIIKEGVEGIGFAIPIKEGMDALNIDLK